MCFIGHGAFGIITKKIWLNYIPVFGIGATTGYHLMPWLGSLDILIGLSILFYPIRSCILWLVIWGAITALLRPLSGEPFAEAIERAGNYGAPLALVLLTYAGAHDKGMASFIDPHTPVTKQTIVRVTWLLRIVVCLLLSGHGWLNMLGKRGLLDQYTLLGIDNPVRLGHILGIAEILAGIAVLVKLFRALLLTVSI